MPPTPTVALHASAPPVIARPERMTKSRFTAGEATTGRALESYSQAMVVQTLPQQASPRGQMPHEVVAQHPPSPKLHEE